MSNLEFNLAINPERRLPLLLLLDTSGSMTEEGRIEQLNDGVRACYADIAADPVARRRVDIAVITFGGEARLLQDFANCDTVSPPSLVADGGTPMGAAILLALDHVAERKRLLKGSVGYYKPLIVLMTDGEPTDACDVASRRVREGAASGAFTFFAVGVGEGARMEKLAQIAPADVPPRPLAGANIREFLKWVSGSACRISRAKPNEPVALAPTDAWSKVSS
jgi:uncharacterized protein YegL